MAAPRKLKSGKWFIEVRRKGIEVSRAFPSHRRAEDWARAMETAIDNGDYAQHVLEVAAPPLSEILDDYIKLDQVKAHKGYAQEKQRALQISTYPLAQIPVTAITGPDLLAYRDTREAECRARSLRLNANRLAAGKPEGKVSDGANTIRNELALISSAYTWLIARKKHGVTENPVKAGIKPKAPKGRKRRLKPDEEELLLACAEGDLKPQGGGRVRNPAFRVVLLFGMDTAMRLSEILNLTWDRVDLVNSVAILEEGETKNGEDRDVPLSPRILIALAELPGKHKAGEKVFDYTTDGFRSTWYETLDKAGIDNLSLHFHDLRHEATSKLFEKSDLSIMEAATVTGHKDPRMLSRYTHLSGADIRKKMYETEAAPGNTPLLNLKERLANLKELLDSELISQEDFEAAKTNILGEV
jgi:integrase